MRFDPNMKQLTPCIAIVIALAVAGCGGKDSEPPGYTQKDFEKTGPPPGYLNSVPKGQGGPPASK